MIDTLRLGYYTPSIKALLDRPARAPERGEFLAPALVAAAFLHAASRSWLRWGDLIVDSGRDWAWAVELARGRSLFTDLAYHHGPLAPYANALALRLFGERLEVLAAVGLVLAASAAALLYRVARRGLGPWGASLVALAFVYDCAFGGLRGYGSYNFVLPYGWASTYGLVASLLSLEALLCWRAGAGTGALLVSSAALAATLLCKLELAAALLGAHAWAWLVDRPKGARARAALQGYAAAILAAGSVYLCYAALVGPEALLGENLLRAHNVSGLTPLKTAGLVRWPRALADAAASLAFAGLAVVLARSVAAARARGVAAAWAGTFAAAAAAAGAWWVGSERQFYGLPLLLLGILAWSRRSKSAPPSLRALEPALVLGLLLLARIALNCGPHHYGFYLLPAGLIGYTWWFWELAPWLAAGGRALPAADLRSYRAAAAAGLAAFVAFNAREAGARLERRTVEATGPRGTLLLEEGNRGRALAEAVKHLAERIAPGEAVLALPEGAGIGFLAGARHPAPIDNFLPREIGTPEKDRAAVELFERLRPVRVLLVPRDTGEFGVGPFGKGYGFELAEHLRTRYALERMIEADSGAGPAFRVAVLRRLE